MSMNTLPFPCVPTAFVAEALMLLCVPITFLAETLPMPCVPTAFAAETLPVPCGPQVDTSSSLTFTLAEAALASDADVSFTFVRHRRALQPAVRRQSNSSVRAILFAHSILSSFVSCGLNRRLWAPCRSTMYKARGPTRCSGWQRARAVGLRHEPPRLLCCCTLLSLQHVVQWGWKGGASLLTERGLKQAGPTTCCT